MLTLEGIVIKSGLKIGRARKFSTQTLSVSPQRIRPADVERELNALNEAIAQVEESIHRHLRQIKREGPDTEILKAHIMILHDPELLSRTREAIRQQHESAAYAVFRILTQISGHFTQLTNDFLAQRAADYLDIRQRLVAELTGQDSDEIDDWEPEQIAVLREATPSQISGFSRQHVSGYCSEMGSFTSHASILTRSMSITAVAAVPGLYDQIRDGDLLILDGIDGKVIVNPDAPTLLLYSQLMEKYLEQESQEQSLTGLPTLTASGRRIKLRCNLDLLSEIERPAKLGADGIGLYRTEFLYLGKETLPSEDLQFEIYRQVAQKTDPHSVIIRTFDLGGDKLSHLIPSVPEDNPYLGCRGIRFSLAQPEILRTQIRAVLRAGVFGNIKLMFPMVTDIKDFYAARDIVEDCRRELRSEGFDCAEKLPLGVMIEVPSAALCAEEFAIHCDFMSIGTNDLVQYTLAADRNNSALTPYYISHHPAVMSLLLQTLKAAKNQGKPVSVCGEMASLPEYVPLLVGLGFDDLSVNPASFLECKRIILGCDAQLDELLQRRELPSSLAGWEEMIYQKLKPYYHL